MIDLGNGQYQIKNKTTGETKIVSSDQLNQYGLKSPTSKSSGDTPILGGVGNASRGVSDLLRNVGLGFAPNLNANLYDTAKTVASLGNVGTDHPYVIGNNMQDNYDNPFRNKQQAIQTLDNTQTPIGTLAEAGKDTAGAASWAVPLAKGPLLARMGLGATAGGLQGISQPHSSPESVGVDAGIGAALNAVAPGVGNLLHLPAKGLSKATAGVTRAATQKARMVEDVAMNRIQKIFGPEVVDTSTEGMKIAPEYQHLFDEFQLDQPSIKVVGDQLAEASAQTEQKLQGLLSNPLAAIPIKEVKAELNNIIDQNMGSGFYGTHNSEDIKRLVNGSLSTGIRNREGEEIVSTMKGGAGTQSNYTNASVPLNDLMALQREVGQKADWETSTLDPWKKLYFGIRDMIDSRTREVASDIGDSNFNRLMADHQKLIEMESRYNAQYGRGVKTLASEVGSPDVAQQNVANKLLSSPDIQALGIGVGGNYAAGFLPEPFQTILRGLSLGGAVGRELPRIAQSPTLTKGLEKTSEKVTKISDSDKLGEVLKQLGIRLPMAVPNQE